MGEYTHYVDMTSKLSLATTFAVYIKSAIRLKTF